MKKSSQMLVITAFVLSSMHFGFATEVAPYFNIENPPPSGPANLWPTTGLIDARIKAGLNNAMITFGDIGQGDCPDLSVVQDAPIQDIRDFLSSGGDVIISISGATCGNTPGRNLTDALDEMIQKTGVSKIDFDVEDSYVNSQGDTDRRNTAILNLVKKYPQLFVSFTVAATPLVDYNTDPKQAGLATGEYNLMQATLARGVKIDRITIMPFAWNFSEDTFSKYPFYELTDMTVESVADQMALLFSKDSKADRKQIYSMMGVLPMIGMGDTVPFFQKDAFLVGQYARDKGLSLVSYYVFQRDQSQSALGQNNDDYLNRYSGVPQKDYDFFHCFEGIDCAVDGGK